VQFAHLHKAEMRQDEVTPALGNVKATHNPAEALNSQVIVATMHKLAYSVDDLGTFDRLILDEAFQSDSTQYLCVAQLADVHLPVGDPGQLDPFSTVDCTKWRGQPEDPLLTSIGVLLRNHPETPIELLPLTRRLAPSAVEVVQPAFYEGLPFRPVTLAGERELRMSAATGGRERRVEDRVLDLAVSSGWA
jgi:hypothetical protein